MVLNQWISSSADSPAPETALDFVEVSTILSEGIDEESEPNPESEKSSDEPESEAEPDEEDDTENETGNETDSGTDGDTDEEKDDEDTDGDDDEDENDDKNSDGDDDEDEEDVEKSASPNTTTEGKADVEGASGAILSYRRPSGWSESDQPYTRGNLALIGMIKEFNGQLAEEISRMKGVFDMPKSTRIEYENDNICDILAIYAALNGSTTNFPHSVEAPTSALKRQLAEIFWNMTRLEFREIEGGGDTHYVITVRRLSAADVAEHYGLHEQRTALDALMTDKMRRKVEAMRDGSILSRLTIDEYRKNRKRIPTGISERRRAVLTAALSLENKVTYFWGGKSYRVGWDDRWGDMRVVFAEGSAMSGIVRPMGLDCSGFVCWSFTNATGDKDAYLKIGKSAASQWDNSFLVKWSEAQPGDLVFCDVPGEAEYDHVGILLSADPSGNVQIIHCSSSRNGVIVTGKETFKYVRRPLIYGD